MTMTTAAPQLNEETLFQMMGGYNVSRTVIAGIQLGVFAALAEGPATASTLAEKCKASSRGMRMLADGLTALGLLEKKADTYQLTPLTARVLVPTQPDYIGAMAETDHLWESWTHLPEVIRSGQPIHQVDQEEKAQQFFPRLVKTLHVRNRPFAREAAKHLNDVLSRADAKVLDVACGSGVWSIACAEAYPQVRVTANDFPTLLDGLRGYLKRHGVEDRFDFLPGDLKTADYGKDRFDVALLGNIVHSEGEASSRDLFKRLHRALKSKGVVVIVDMVPDDNRSGPVFPVLFALNMLLNTTEGDTYTFAEYKAWLTDAGFVDVRAIDIGAHSPLVVATRP